MPKTKGQMWCSAINCKNYGGKNDEQGKHISFFRFPLEPERCKKWVISSRRSDLMNKDPAYLYANCRLCSEHFESIMFLNDLRNRLHKHAVPTLFNVPNPPPLRHSQRIRKIRKESSKPAPKRRRKRVDQSKKATLGEAVTIDGSTSSPRKLRKNIQHNVEEETLNVWDNPGGLSSNCKESASAVENNQLDVDAKNANQEEILSTDASCSSFVANPKCNVNVEELVNVAGNSNTIQTEFLASNKTQTLTENITQKIPCAPRKLELMRDLGNSKKHAAKKELENIHTGNIVPGNEDTYPGVAKGKDDFVPCDSQDFSNSSMEIVEMKLEDCMDIMGLENSEGSLEKGEKLCRVCANECADLLPIFEENGASWMIEEKIKKYLPIKVAPNDELPQQVCPLCLEKLNICHELVTGCVEADKKLKDLFRSKSVHPKSDVESDGDHNTASLDMDVSEDEDESANRGVREADLNVDPLAIHEYLKKTPCKLRNLPEPEPSVELVNIDVKGTGIKSGKLFITRKKQTNKAQAKCDRATRKYAEKENDVQERQDGDAVQVSQNPVTKGSVILLPATQQNPSSTTKGQNKEIPIQEQSLNKFFAVSLGSQMSVPIVRNEHPQSTSSHTDSTVVTKTVDLAVNSGNSSDNRPSTSCDPRENGRGTLRQGSSIPRNIKPKKDILVHMCSICNQFFINGEELAKHLLVLHANNMLQCMACLTILVASEESLAVHMALCPKQRKETNTPTTSKSSDNCDSGELEGVSASNFLPSSEDSRTKNLDVSKDLIHISSGAPKRAISKASTLLSKHPNLNFSMIQMNTETNENGEMKLKLTSNIVTCHQCEKKFISEHKLKAHFMKQHTPLLCQYCGKTFSGKVRLQRHELYHKSKWHSKLCKNRFPCEKCKRVFGGTKSLENHIRTHVERKYKCVLCNKEFKSHSGLYFHKAYHNNDVRSFLCDLCGKSYRYKSNLMVHVLTHKGVKKAGPREKKFPCQFCGKLYIAVSKLKIHERKHTGERPYACDMCDKSFREKHVLKQHSWIHSADYPYQCSVCGRKFRRCANMIAHEKIHFRKPVTCKICNAEFSDGRALYYHKKSSHSPEEREKEHAMIESEQFQCNICCKVLSTKASLSYHLQGHEGNTPFVCDVCGKSFFRLQYYETHCKYHTGEREFSCNICNKAFVTKAILNSHLATHNKQKPFVCDVCQRAFTLRCTLRQHQLIHSEERPHICTYCPKAFRRRDQLNIHVRIHTGEKPFTCKICGRSFTQRTDMVKHRRRHTNEKPYQCSVCGEAFTERRFLRKHETVHNIE